LFEFRDWKFLYFIPPFDRTHHDSSDYFVRVPKRHAFPNEIVGKFGRVHVARCCGGQRAFLVDGDVAQHRARDLQTRAHRVERIEHRFFIFLHVFVVGERQPLEHRQHGEKLAKHAAGFAAHELHRIGVLLLRHQARAGRDRVA